jgi:hypothetical protein
VAAFEAALYCYGIDGRKVNADALLAMSEQHSQPLARLVRATAQVLMEPAHRRLMPPAEARALWRVRQPASAGTPLSLRLRRDDRMQRVAGDVSIVFT